MIPLVGPMGILTFFHADHATARYAHLEVHCASKWMIPHGPLINVHVCAQKKALNNRLISLTLQLQLLSQLQLSWIFTLGCHILESLLIKREHCLLLSWTTQP